MKITLSLKLYFAISPSVKWTLFLWGMLMLLAGYFALDAGGTVLYMAYAILAILPVAGVLYVLTGFMALRSRVNAIQFPVEGWEELSSERDLLDGKTWRNLRVEIQLKPGHADDIRSANAILKRMIISANKRFYTAQLGSAKRRHWIITDSPLIAYGSAQRETLGDFIRMCTALARAGINVERCTIAPTGKPFAVDSESDTMT